jgi:hypothetical protein
MQEFWKDAAILIGCIAGMVFIATWIVLWFLVPFWIFGMWRRIHHISDTLDRAYKNLSERTPTAQSDSIQPPPADLLECPDCHASSPESAFATEGKYMICPKCKAKLEVE